MATQIIAGQNWNPGTPLSANQLAEINSAIINSQAAYKFSLDAIDQYRRQTPVAPAAQPVRPVSATQAVARSTVNAANSAVGSAPGAGAGNEDIANPTQARIADRFDSRTRLVDAQPNVLDQYSSYTYNISLYLLSSDDYRSMVTLGRPILRGSNLLMATGGAPQGAGSRNQRFPLDFYLDDVVIQQLQPGRGSRGANGVVSLNFKITEPNGITLLDNLYHAVDELLGGVTDSSKKQNYASQHYLMHIKFYGYDQNGNLQQANTPRDASTVTDSRTIVEKFIPFRFVNITYRVASQLVEYSCQAVVPQNDIGTGQGRGVIPYNVELSASSLGEAFSGAATVSAAAQPTVNDRTPSPISNSAAAAAPPKANSSSGPGTVVNGLVDALNNYQRELTLPQGPDNESIYDEYDEFEVVFTDTVLSDASTQPPGPTPKGQVSSPLPVSAAARIFGSKQSANNESKKISAVAGTSLVQFLDQVIRSSSFIYDQQIQGYDADGQLIKLPGKDVGLLSWYRIDVQAVPKAYDRKRNDFAYKITYRVSPYLINDPKSPYFPETKFRGVHKAYDYWFTGQNTQILSYQQDFNYSYYMVISGPQPNSNRTLANFREYEKRLYQPRSNESDQGQSSRINEPAANLAERQYNAADLARARMTIVGDPAWIHQGSVWRGITGVQFTLNPFFSDGTINVEVEEPLFMISWNKPSDYDLNTGVTDPSARLVGGGNQLTTIGPGGGTQTYIYRAVTVTSTFGAGRFTQDIEGVLVTFPALGIRYDSRRELESLRTNTVGQLTDTADETARVAIPVDAIVRGRIPTRNNSERSLTSAVPAGDLSPSAAGRVAQTAADNNTLDPEAATFLPSFRSPVSPTVSPPPEPPTSGNQTIVPQSAAAVRPQVLQSTEFSLLELKRADPVLAGKFTQYRDSEQTRIFEQQQERLTKKRIEQNGNRPLTPRESDRIRTFALSSARLQSSALAVEEFKEPLKALGPKVYKEINPSVDAAIVPRVNRTQLIDRDT